MHSPPLFIEQQSFLKHWWALLLTLPITLFVIPILLYYNGHLHPSGTLGGVLAISILIVGCLCLLRLDTRLTATGVEYRMTPLHLKWTHLEWSAVDHASVRSYDPLSEYGGWGIKGRASDRAYNVAGSWGLQLVLRNGKRILIGTQQPTAIRHFLTSIQFPVRLVESLSD